MAAGHELQAAVVLVAAVNGHPRGNAGSRLHAQVVVVLVERLAARARGLEIEHRLHGIGFPADEVHHRVPDALVEHPVQAGLVPAVHVDHARVLEQRITRLRLGNGPAGLCALRIQTHEMLAIESHLFGRE